MDANIRLPKERDMPMVVHKMIRDTLMVVPQELDVTVLIKCGWFLGWFCLIGIVANYRLFYHEKEA